MLTLLLISSNQESLLKEHLYHYDHIIKSINGSIILVDDGSNDQTKDYVKTHFKSIRYMRNSQELGYVKSFNKAIDYVTTPYILCVDLAMDIRFLPIKEALSTLKKQSLFMIGFSFSRDKKNYLGFKLEPKAMSMNVEPITTITECFCSEIMLLDRQKVNQLEGLSNHYHNTVISWYDLIYRSIQKSYQISISESVCYKKSTMNTFFSCLTDKKSLLKDNFLFQWRFQRSSRQIAKRTIAIMFIFLSFNGSKILQFLQAYFQWLFFTKRYYTNNLTRNKNSMFMLNWFKQLLRSKQKDQTASVLITDHDKWTTSIPIKAFSFSVLFFNTYSDVYIDSCSVKKPVFYILSCINFLARVCQKKQRFYFVSSDYALEHELAYNQL